MRSLNGTQHDSRWPVALTVLATLLLQVTLPEQLTFGPTWLAPVLELLLLVPLLIAEPPRPGYRPPWQRVVAIVMIAIINLANVGSLVLLVRSLLAGGKASGHDLIIESIKIWLTNVLVFALWYWELDRGGPGRRTGSQAGLPDFLFPQMTTPSIAPPNWHPIFVDYLYLAFTNATAFSPTDTLPLTPWAKLLMLIQSLASLLTVALVAARAVNILT